ncbi:Uncharacterised protein [Shigella sonnei]|nr:Uncharacterised protein [Shigella sonnei]
MTAPNTTMIASSPSVLPKPAFIVCSSDIKSMPASIPTDSAATSKATIELILNFKFSTSIRPMPNTTQRMLSTCITFYLTWLNRCYFGRHVM